MKTMQSYEYEYAMLEVLDKTFKKACKELDYFESHKDNYDLKTAEKEQSRAYKSLDEAIAQKELVEATIGECVNLQQDGVIRIGIDNPIDYKSYLKTLERRCEIGELFGRTILQDDNKMTGGVSHKGETLAEFIDEVLDGGNIAIDKKGQFNLDEVNLMLFENGIEPLEYDGEKLVVMDSFEKKAPYSKEYWGDEPVYVELPKKEVLNCDDRFGTKIITGIYDTDKLEKSPTLTIPRYMYGEYLTELGYDMEADDGREERVTGGDGRQLFSFVQRNYPSYDVMANSDLKELADKLYEQSVGKDVETQETEDKGMEKVRIELTANPVLYLYDKGGAVRDLLRTEGLKPRMSETLKMDVPVKFVAEYLNINMESEKAKRLVRNNPEAFDDFVYFMSERYPSVDLTQFETARINSREASGYDLYGEICRNAGRDMDVPMNTFNKADVPNDWKDNKTPKKGFGNT